MNRGGRTWLGLIVMCPAKGGADKAEAWATSAAMLREAAEERLSRHDLSADDRRVWTHIMTNVAPSVENRASIIRRRAR